MREAPGQSAVNPKTPSEAESPHVPRYKIHLCTPVIPPMTQIFHAAELTEGFHQHLRIQIASAAGLQRHGIDVLRPVRLYLGKRQDQRTNIGLHDFFFLFIFSQRIDS